MKISWAYKAAINIHTSDVLFSIVVEEVQKSQIDKNLFDAVSGFSNELYINEQAFPLKLRLFGKQGNDLPLITSHLLSPNPFSEESILRFELQENSPCQLKLYDLTGKLLVSKEVLGERGQNELVIRKKDLGSGGLFYYVLSSSYGSVSDRMIVQD